MPTTLIITVDLDCCRCSNKIQKILCCIQDRGEFVIEKIVYENDKVVVSGPFDAEKLSCKLWCKAGKIIKNIEIVKPPPPNKPPAESTPKPQCKPEPPPCKLIYPFPYYPYQCPPPPPPAGWPPCTCPPPYCYCHAKPPPPPPPTPPPKPKPEPPKPPPCHCPTWPSSCYCGGGGYYPPPYMPYPMVVCDDSPPYGACAIM